MPAHGATLLICPATWSRTPPASDHVPVAAPAHHDQAAGAIPKVVRQQHHALVQAGEDDLPTAEHDAILVLLPEELEPAGQGQDAGEHGHEARQKPTQQPTEARTKESAARGSATTRCRRRGGRSWQSRRWYHLVPHVLVCRVVGSPSGLVASALFAFFARCDRCSSRLPRWFLPNCSVM